MKKTMTMIIIILLLVTSLTTVSAQEEKNRSDGFLGWLAGLFSDKEQTDPVEETSEEPILPLLTEDMLEEDTFEKRYALGKESEPPSEEKKRIPPPPTSASDSTSAVTTVQALTTANPCNALICMQGKKELNCIEDYRTCKQKYDSCRIISCDPELAMESPCYAEKKETCTEKAHLCQYKVKTGSIESLKQLTCRGDYEACRLKYDVCQCGIPEQEERCCCFTDNAYKSIPQSRCNKCLPSEKCQAITEEETDCPETKNTCYYKTDPVSTSEGFIDATLVAFTCQGTYSECSARYEKCECGLNTEPCTAEENTCAKTAEFSTCKDSQIFCLRKYEDCTCGNIPCCKEGYNKCYQRGKEYLCDDDYDVCIKRYDRCECGLPGIGCAERKHNCYDSVQDTTTYKEMEKTVCKGNYYDCAMDHDMCLCGTEKNLSTECPLKQHSCWNDGRSVICYGNLTTCKERYGRCDCGIQLHEAKLS